MSPRPIEHADPDLKRVPHVVFGIGAIVMVLIAALLLLLLSGHFSRHFGASLVVAIGLPILIALVVFAAKRWRDARAG